ncbi:MAG: hypothetical protein M9949_12115 [Candidatus Kapabacteria bacterium]|nr:hypothetical protein [Candidatus Kapabacteria bacterium]
MKNFLQIVLLVIFVGIIHISAQVPNQISWQGVLTDAQGDALQGQNEIIIRIFSSDDNVNDLIPLWTETYNLNLMDGLVNLALGDNPGNPINLNFNQALWLEIVVNGGNPLNRIKLTSVPYSIMSKDVEDGAVVRSLGKDEQLKDDIKLVEGKNVIIEDNMPNENDIRISALPELKIEQNIDNSTSIFIWNPVTNIYNIWIIVFPTGEVWWFRELIIYETLIIKHEESERSVEITAGEGITLRGPDGEITGRWNTDGTSEHMGEETFHGGIKIPLVGGGEILIDDEGITIYDAEGNVVTDFAPDGTSYHSGLETFEGGIEVPLAGDGKILIGDQGIKIYDAEGNVLTEFAPDGTSLHKGLETFEGGISVPLLSGGRFDIDKWGFNVYDVDGFLKGGLIHSEEGVSFGVLSSNGYITMDEQGLTIKDNNSNVITQFKMDGTSFHSGKETFEGGIEVPLSNGGKLEIHESGVSVYDAEDNYKGGILQDEQKTYVGVKSDEGKIWMGEDGLTLWNADDEIVGSWNFDGTSFHRGKETFAGGIDVPLTDGGKMQFNIGSTPLQLSGLGGNDVLTVSQNGATEQSGIGTFKAGIEVPLTDGGTIQIHPGSTPLLINGSDGDDVLSVSSDTNGTSLNILNDLGSLKFGSTGIVVSNTDAIVATVNYDGSASFGGPVTIGDKVTILNSDGDKKFEFDNSALWIFNTTGTCTNLMGQDGSTVQLGLAQFWGGFQVANGNTQLKNTTITGTLSTSGALTVNSSASLSGNCSVGGNLTVIGDLNVTGNKNFRIDHPDDPYNKYLFHASIESDEVLNQYSGNVITDANGVAIVTLPDYVEKINIDFRYQLTVIGDFAQAIISKKIQNNQFEIRTDKANMEVSWMITAKRNDSVLQYRPFQAVRDKSPADRGKLLFDLNKLSNLGD